MLKAFCGPSLYKHSQSWESLSTWPLQQRPFVNFLLAGAHTVTVNINSDRSLACPRLSVLPTQNFCTQDDSAAMLTSDWCSADPLERKYLTNFPTVGFLSTRDLAYWPYARSSERRHEQRLFGQLSEIGVVVQHLIDFLQVLVLPLHGHF